MHIAWTDPFADPALPHALPQSAAYARAAADCGARVRRAVWRDGGAVVAEALVLDRPALRLVTRGPVLAPGLGPADARAFLRRLACTARTTVATTDAGQGFGLVPLVTTAQVAVWNLTPAPDALRAGLAAKWRNRLVAAERAGIRPAPARADRLPALIAPELAQRARRGYRALPPAFTRALPGPALRLWCWRHAGQVAAAMVFVRHGCGATYHIGWAHDAARAAGAHGAMLWQATLALQAEGVRWLDLGLVDTGANPGLARFKLGTGADLRQPGPTCLVLPG